MPALRVKQSDAMPTITLNGCAPVPLAHYLKALGILRLVSEQADRNATGYWQGEQFILNSHLDCDSLTEFFLRKYQPTPVLNPGMETVVFLRTREQERWKFLKLSPKAYLTGSLYTGLQFVPSGRFLVATKSLKNQQMNRRAEFLWHSAALCH